MAFQIVNHKDEFLYCKEARDWNRDTEITRCASVWLVNEKGEFLIALRSHKKTHFANVWECSASGFVEDAETYMDTAIKETHEEVGVDVIGKLTEGPKIFMKDNHEYFTQYFYARIASNTSFTLQATEVDEVRWISLPELMKWYEKSPKEFVSTFDSIMRAAQEYKSK